MMLPMPTIKIRGCTLHYRIRGDGPLLVLTPGGRVGMDATRALGDELAKDFRLLEWDRRNTGASDVSIDGDASEQEIWAADLAELLQRLDFAPARSPGVRRALASPCSPRFGTLRWCAR